MFVEIKTNDSTFSDWLTISVDGKQIFEGHHLTLWDFTEFLSFIGANWTRDDSVKFEE